MVLLSGLPNARAHEDDHTHASLMVGSLIFLDWTFPEDGALFPPNARMNLRNGTIAEDDEPNFVHHFYDPKTGLNTHTGASLITAPQRASTEFWNQAIADFRGGNRNGAFEKLGHVCHLLQDMTSPAHVHNDIHAGHRPFSDHCSDGDDFENWGWSDCPRYTLHNILQYISSTNLDATLTTKLTDGLRLIFKNQPQRVSHTAGPNVAYSYVHALADAVYNFTTFEVRLRDTFDPNDRGERQFSDMFPSLEEARASGAWYIDKVGFSEGLCLYSSGGSVVVNESWWIMPGCNQRYESLRTVFVVDGLAYIENTGGGDSGLDIPDNLIPAEYPKPWFTARYGTKYNTNNLSMLKIYGDVLYPAAVAYGAGLLQTFLDQAIMPRPITQEATVLDGGTVLLNGRVNPGGTDVETWFELGTSTNYGRLTSRQVFSSSTAYLPVTSEAITGLLPETTYTYRLVASNQFGIRHGTNRTFRTLNFSLTGGGLNAWQITDNLTQSGSTLTYSTNLSTPQRQAASANGWRVVMNSRLTTDFGGNKTMTFAYGTGSGRFLVWLDFDASGNLIADLDGTASVALTSNGIGATLYHTHEIRYTNGTARYYFDGLLKGTWTGTGFDLPAGQIIWGAGSSGGMGQMNFNQVRFETLGVVALYDAGNGANPPEAPDPVANGWTRSAGTVSLSEHFVAPDGEPFVPAVETLPATGLTLSSAQLNGEVNPHGDATVAWFEWGLTTSYGNRTVPRALGAGQIETNLSTQISGLSFSTTYHFRLVASNGFGIRLGNDRTFQTPSYLITGALPNAWQITDDSSASGSRWNYTTNLNFDQRSAASNSWRFTITSRLVTDFGGSETMTFIYGTGGRRYAVLWDFDDDTNLVARLENQSPVIVASNHLGAKLYHTHELRYTNGSATYSVDGRIIGTWPGAALTNQNGQAFWGAGSSAGQGQMNFQRVEFQVGSSNIATYDAGTQGTPALDPATRGWRLNDAGSPARATNLTEQLEIFLPTVDTLAATAIGSTRAQLNGRVNPNGQETYTRFEWGIRTTYGIYTEWKNAGPAFTAFENSNILAGLAVDTEYHFRAVASNSIATTFGEDQTFRTAWFVDASINLLSVNDGSAAWGDYDNDGDLDLLLSGQTDAGAATRIYRNNGSGNFTQVSTGLIGVSQSSAAWGDYDRDGDLDILLSGLSPTGAVSHIYRNDTANFTVINAGLPGVFMSSVAWVDFDNDGDLDVLLTGADNASNRLARIYRNDGVATFQNINAGLTGTSEGAAAAGDFDGDGDHDLVITGLDPSGSPSSEYYRNDGAGVFTRVDLNLPGVHFSAIAPADFDNDGDLDLLLSGSTGEGELSRLFRNIGNGSTVEFEEMQTTVANISSGSVAWGDFDNDGDPDIALSGWRGGPFSAIYRNDGEGVFVPLTQDLPGLFASSTAWGDLDDDGDLDLLLTGRNDEGSAPARALHFYRNLAPMANTVPTAPSELAGSGVGNSATVRWKAATDTQTLLSALTYNLVLSSATNGVDLASPMANTTNGYRRVAQFGSAGHNNSWTFTGLNPGTYYFSVQAVDSAYAGGPFAPWQSFNVEPPPVIIIASEILQPGRVRIHFAGPDGVAYEVWASADLQAWTRLGPGLTLSPGEFEYIDAAAPPDRRFYQIRRNTP